MDPKHNQPPSDTEIMLGKLAEQNADLLNRTEELASSASRCQVTDDASAGDATTLVKSINGVVTEAEKRQKEAKRPHFEMANAAFDYFKPTLGNLSQAKTAAITQLDAYRQKKEAEAEVERKRLEDQAKKLAADAEKIAAAAQTDEEMDLAVETEQAAKQAVIAAAVVQTMPIRSSFGHIASSRTTWEFRVTDPDGVPRQYLMVNEAAIKAAVKGGARSIPGVEIFESKKTVVR